MGAGAYGLPLVLKIAGTFVPAIFLTSEKRGQRLKVTEESLF